MVVTPNGTQEELDKAMAPFHEFGCTGLDNEYVQNIDQLPEARELYKKETTRRYKDSDGKLHDPYADEFYREPTPEESKAVSMGGTGHCNGVSYTSKDWGDGRGYRAKVHFVPAGWSEVEVPQSDVRTFAEFIEYHYGRDVIEGKAAPDLKEKHKYGWCRMVNGEVTELIDRDNPDHKWDWYTEGGRWSDYFIPKNRNATTTKGRKRDIDFARMRSEREAVAAGEWDTVNKAIAPHLAGYKTWESVLKAHAEDYEAARKEYREQPAVVAFHKNDRDRIFDSVDNYLMPRQQYITNEGLRRITSFAFLRDGKWAEKGRMGWWACVSEEKENWGAQFADLLGAVPEDHFLTIVDCHT